MLPTPVVMDTAHLEVQGDVNLQDPGICGFFIQPGCYRSNKFSMLHNIQQQTLTLQKYL